MRVGCNIPEPDVKVYLWNLQWGKQAAALVRDMPFEDEASPTIQQHAFVTRDASKATSTPEAPQRAPCAPPVTFAIASVQLHIMFHKRPWQYIQVGTTTRTHRLLPTSIVSLSGLVMVAVPTALLFTFCADSFIGSSGAGKL